MNVAFQLFGKIWFVGFEDKKKIESLAMSRIRVKGSECEDDCEQEDGEDEKQMVYPMGGMKNEYR